MFSFKSIVLIAALAAGAECSGVAVAAPLVAPAHVGYAHTVPQNIPPYASQVSVFNRALGPFAAPYFAAPYAAYPGAPAAYASPAFAPAGYAAAAYPGPAYPAPAYPAPAAYAAPFPYGPAAPLLRAPFGVAPASVR